MLKTFISGLLDGTLIGIVLVMIAISVYIIWRVWNV